MNPLLTEKEFKKIYDFCRTDKCYGQGNYKEHLREARGKGWVKKSKIEQARDFVLQNRPNNTDYENGVNDCAVYFEEAIKEIEED